MKVFQSSNLNTGHYNPETSRLTIGFVSGYAYEYDVPPEVWDALSTAVDPNAYFQAYIRPIYRGKRILSPQSGERE